MDISAPLDLQAGSPEAIASTGLYLSLVIASRSQPDRVQWQAGRMLRRVIFSTLRFDNLLTVEEKKTLTVPLIVSPKPLNAPQHHSQFQSSKPLLAIFTINKPTLECCYVTQLSNLQ